MTLAELQAAHPEIRWTEPVKIMIPGSTVARYACRICVANDGLTGPQAAALPIDATEIHEHIKREHAQ